MHLAWLIWCLLLVGVWLVLFTSLKNMEIRKEMLAVSLSTSLLGLTEPLFVPDYWAPLSLFDLARTTGFDIESLIFSFGIGGLAFALYLRVFSIEREEPIPKDERIKTRHKYHFPMLFITPALFILLLLLTSLNPIYITFISLMTGGITTWYCRPDLKKKMFFSAFMFLGLYFFYFLTLIVAFPGYVQMVWNLSALTGILIFGIPVEELMFAFSFGFYWSTVYEHFRWEKLVDAHEK